VAADHRRQREGRSQAARGARLRRSLGAAPPRGHHAPAHPELAEARFADLAAKGNTLAFYEASLLVESGRYKDFDGLVVVTASPETQLERVLARGGLTEEQAQARIDAQLPMLAKVRVADYLVDNDGDVAETKAQVERLIGSLR
jgi:dephospho-CoA kinase